MYNKETRLKIKHQILKNSFSEKAAIGKIKVKGKTDKEILAQIPY